MNLDSVLLDELARAFVEAAMRRIESEPGEIEVQPAVSDRRRAHLTRRKLSKMHGDDGELGKK
jgi:hypothetical protein